LFVLGEEITERDCSEGDSPIFFVSKKPTQRTLFF
jgi:hypothetical protein